MSVCEYKTEFGDSGARLPVKSVIGTPPTMLPLGEAVAAGVP
jgi:hypothetical protein